MGRKPSEVSRWLQEAEDITAMIMELLERCKKHDRSLCNAWGDKSETANAATPAASSRNGG